MMSLDRYGVEITLTNGDVVVRRDPGYYGSEGCAGLELRITDNGTAVIVLLPLEQIGGPPNQQLPVRVAEAFAPGTWVKAVRYSGEPKGDRSWLSDY